MRSDASYRMHNEGNADVQDERLCIDALLWNERYYEEIIG